MYPMFGIRLDKVLQMAKTAELDATVKKEIVSLLEDVQKYVKENCEGYLFTNRSFNDIELGIYYESMGYKEKVAAGKTLAIEPKYLGADWPHICVEEVVVPQLDSDFDLELEPTMRQMNYLNHLLEKAGYKRQDGWVPEYDEYDSDFFNLGRGNVGRMIGALCKGELKDLETWRFADFVDWLEYKSEAKGEDEIESGK